MKWSSSSQWRINYHQYAGGCWPGTPHPLPPVDYANSWLTHILITTREAPYLRFLVDPNETTDLKDTLYLSTLLICVVIRKGRYVLRGALLFCACNLLLERQYMTVAVSLYLFLVLHSKYLYIYIYHPTLHYWELLLLTVPNDVTAQVKV